MATPPTFTSGSILTSAQMNAVGLWKIASGSTTNTSALDVNSVFSSDFDNYRIVVQMASRTTLQYARCQLRTVGALTTTGYQSASKWYNITQSNTTFQDNDQSTGALTGGPSGDQSLTRWALWTFDLANPNKAQTTAMTGSGTGVRKDDNWYSWISGGVQTDSTQFTGIRFLANSGTFDINYIIYGYRN